MSTITDKQIIDDLIKNNGYYYENGVITDDPRVVYIVEYTNAWGAITWGITYVIESPARQIRYLIETPYVSKPKVLFNAQDKTQ